MTGGFYYSKKSKDDVNLNEAVEKIARKESRSKSDVIKSLLWLSVAAYNAKKQVVAASKFPAHNPFAKIVTPQA